MEEARPSVEDLALALHEHIFTQPQEKFANQPWKLVKTIGIFAQNQAEDKSFDSSRRLSESYLSTMAVFSLIIINKAGGLIYQREFQPGLRKLSTNDYLVLAGTFHGVHAITRSITPKIPISAPLPTTPASSSNVALSSPSGTSTPTPAASAYSLPNPGVPVTGLESLETDKFRLTCFQTLTGTKFLLFTDPLMANIDAVMKKIYELYSDYVMKNPFYQLEMPVRCEAFDRHLGGWLRGRT
ncbi:transport protein particle subunit trs23 [Aspergillus lentulus]|nr:transport protein particle subunit trs23 [Aspergillus lentulus]GFF67226.1 transport protein particle subunit trs23 [Aspergillus lentulus]GFF67347.1 transport protein particle subunit trs23 [Aspergillus lentulus]GFG05398.1 transport protein particle subunit trs23 [Aspergillus lentulus]